MYKPRPGRRFEEWEHEAILAAYVAGEKLTSIALEFNTTDTTITSLARRRGIPRDRQRRRSAGTFKRPDAVQIEKIYNLEFNQEEE